MTGWSLGGSSAKAEFSLLYGGSVFFSIKIFNWLDNALKFKKGQMQTLTLSKSVFKETFKPLSDRLLGCYGLCKLTQ